MSKDLPYWLGIVRRLWNLVRESHAEPLRGEACAAPAIAHDGIAITFIGHSSFLIQVAGRALLVDPVFATRLILMRRQRRPGLRISGLPAIDAVLLTHAHMDHLNRPSLRAITRAMRRRKLPAPIVIVPNGVEDLVRDLGFSSIHSLAWWQSFQLPGATPAREPVTITATPARHWGARLFHDAHRGYGGYVLQSPGSPAIYHSGDTAYFAGFTEIAERLHPDVALLPIGAYSPDSYRVAHTSPEEALQAFIDVGARTMVPMHYNTFRLGHEPMDEPLPRLLAAAARAGVSQGVHPLAEGESWFAAKRPGVPGVPQYASGLVQTGG